MNTEIQLFVSRGIVDGLLLAIWVYVPEIYPTKVRNIAVGLINTAGKLGAVFGILSVQVKFIKGEADYRGKAVVNLSHEQILISFRSCDKSSL